MNDLALREAEIEAEREMPRPTIWPAALAAGLSAAAFGMLTVGIIFYVGVVLVAVAVTGWMRELLEEGR
jgi:uncharacterized membrane protein YjjP (DUF1212 family)